MIDLAGFYAAIANEGQRVIPYTIDTIEKNGQAVYRHDAGKPVIVAGGDRAAFFQLRNILEGVVTRGTAAGIMNTVGNDFITNFYIEYVERFTIIINGNIQPKAV
jgi:membrane peptidoglycan carboxypeptidase